MPNPKKTCDELIDTWNIVSNLGSYEWSGDRGGGARRSSGRETQEEGPAVTLGHQRGSPQ